MPNITREISGEARVNPSSDEETWFLSAKSRTSEEIAAARKLVFPKAPRPLPTGKTLEAVFVGALPDEKSDAEIIAALAE